MPRVLDGEERGEVEVEVGGERERERGRIVGERKCQGFEEEGRDFRGDSFEGAVSL